MIKIFHTADTHLGMGFANYGDKGSVLSEARYNCLEKLVTMANEHEADIFVLAGDLFDKLSGFTAENIKRVRGALNDFSGNLVLILPGNHDYIAENSSIWRHFQGDLGSKIMLIDEAKPVVLDNFEIPITIYPAPCRSKHSPENAIGWISEIEKSNDVLHIGIAHGSVQGKSPDFDGKYFPMTIKQISETGLDLLMLGHTHITFPERPDANDIIFNPGTPEPDGLDCRHEGRAFLHIFDGKQRKESQLLSTGTYRFYDVQEKVESTHDLERISTTWSSNAHSNAVLRLKLKGHLDLEEWERIGDLRTALEAKITHLVLDLDDLRKRISPEMIRSEFPEESFANKLLCCFEDEEALQLAYEWITEVRK